MRVAVLFIVAVTTGQVGHIARELSLCGPFLLVWWMFRFLDILLCLMWRSLTLSVCNQSRSKGKALRERERGVLKGHLT